MIVLLVILMRFMKKKKKNDKLTNEMTLIEKRKMI